jgi:hypothetical protein
LSGGAVAPSPFRNPTLDPNLEGGGEGRGGEERWRWRAGEQGWKGGSGWREGRERESGARGGSGGLGFMPAGWVAPRRVPQEKQSGGGSDCGGGE